MIPIIVISHGNMAQGIKETMEMIVGEQEHVYFVSLKDDKPDQFSVDIKNILKTYSKQQQILILADLFGGSPFLTTAQIIMQEYTQVRQLSGINLPMLLECVFSRLTMDIDELVTLAQNTGREEIKKLELNGEYEVSSDGI